MTIATLVLSGILTMGYVVVSLFFLKFWRESHDRLFGLFALSFGLLAVQQALLPFVHAKEVLYAVRLLAFLLIVWAIVQKNRGPAVA